MSEDTFHVHGPHDHELEHAAHSKDPFAGRIAVMTAIFATVGALFGYMSGATQNDALLYKNDAAITLLTRDSRLKYFSYAVAAVSLALGALATLHI